MRTPHHTHQFLHILPLLLLVILASTLLRAPCHSIILVLVVVVFFLCHGRLKGTHEPCVKSLEFWLEITSTTNFAQKGVVGTVVSQPAPGENRNHA